MVSYDTQESKQVVYAIIKEDGTATPVVSADGGTTALEQRDNAMTPTRIANYVFMIGATSVGRDTSKTINRTDLVGTQNQRVTDGSISKNLTVDFFALRPAALGDHLYALPAVNPVHGEDATTETQYALTALGADKAISSSNTYTVRIFKDCELDANEDADISTATEILDYEGVHFSSVSESAPGGGDVTLSLGLEAERVTYPAAYDALPN